ncbi:MAG: hypothetical protein KBA72_14485 [Thermoanaerobaculia bacterium]|nr:hypothetical protein [Thermoanaerobaculia bacterium]
MAAELRFFATWCVDVARDIGRETHELPTAGDSTGMIENRLGEIDE